jgi:hypothetical protein
MWHHIVVVLADVLEERIASIFRVEGKIRKSTGDDTVRTIARRLMLENKLSYLRAGKGGGGTRLHGKPVEMDRCKVSAGIECCVGGGRQG